MFCASALGNGDRQTSDCLHLHAHAHAEWCDGIGAQDSHKCKQLYCRYCPWPQRRAKGFSSPIPHTYARLSKYVQTVFDVKTVLCCYKYDIKL